MSLGKRLKQERERRGWSQKYVAQKIGITNTVLSNYERDYRDPDTDTLKKIANLYEVKADYLLGLSEVRREVFASISMHGEGTMNIDATTDGKNSVYHNDQKTEFIIKELVSKYSIDLTVPGNKEKLEKIIELVDFLPSKNEQSE